MSFLTTTIIQKLESNFSQYLQQYDDNIDGTLSRKELLNAVVKSSSGYIDWCTAYNVVDQIFQLLDQDHDNRLSIDEVRESYSYLHQLTTSVALVSPQNGTSFGHWPRNTFLTWSPVRSAASYLIEVEYEISGNWYKLINQSQSSVYATSYSFRFVGPYRGRWKVTALNGQGQAIAKSDWWMFIYRRLIQDLETSPDEQASIS